MVINVIVKIIIRFDIMVIKDIIIEINSINMVKEEVKYNYKSIIIIIINIKDYFIIMVIMTFILLLICFLPFLSFIS